MTIRAVSTAHISTVAMSVMPLDQHTRASTFTLVSIFFSKLSRFDQHLVFGERSLKATGFLNAKLLNCQPVSSR